MNDDETADVLREAIEAYLTEADTEELDADDLAWNLVNALRSARKRQATGS
ncbi:hypothetical protein [Streptomyces vinaceus]|uniref:hypothetical protein n=1 Tax=Streptomyces vinaceus TaxID=1960 RepID=UPI0035D73229